MVVVVICFTASSITCGFAGDCAPRSMTENPFSFVADSTSSSSALYYSYEHLLLEVFESIFFSHLHAHPRESCVFVCGCGDMPPAFRRALRHILYERLRVRESTIIPSSPLPLHCTGKVTGLVVAAEHMLISAAAVFCGHKLCQFVRRLPESTSQRESKGVGGGQGTGNVTQKGVANAILAALTLCPTDVRRPLAQNILLCGCPLLSAYVSAPCISTHLPGCVKDSDAATLLPYLAELGFSGISSGVLVPWESVAWLTAGDIARAPNPSVIRTPIAKRVIPVELPVSADSRNQPALLPCTGRGRKE